MCVCHSTRHPTSQEPGGVGPGRRAVCHAANIIWLFLIDRFKNVFPMLYHCLRAVKGDPLVNNSNLNWKEIHTWNFTCTQDHSTLKKQLQCIELING